MRGVVVGHEPYRYYPQGDLAPHLVGYMAQMDAEEAGRMLINVWNGLEKIFQRPVDLLTENSLRNPYLRAEVERTKQLIYDGSKRQVLV